MVDEDELLWFGRPPDTTRLVSSDDQIANAVRRRQAEVYAMLDKIVQEMEEVLAEIRGWLETGGFSLADPRNLVIVALLGS